MSCLGVHYALTDAEVGLVSERIGDDEALHELIEEGALADLWDTDWVQESDKAWDAIDRCLTQDAPHGAVTPLHKCVLGGRRVYKGDDYFMALITATETKEVATAIRDINQSWMRERYFRIDSADYGFPLTEEDFTYTWDWFEGVQSFFQRAAAAERAVLFTASQ